MARFLEWVIIGLELFARHRGLASPTASSGGSALGEILAPSVESFSILPGTR